jgi:heme-degrading monooxygenase HmoA
MIARIWHGRTRASDFDRYSDFLRTVAIPDYSATPGFISLTFLRKIEGEEAHFTLITYWKNFEVIRNFAGDDVDKAKYYPEDDQFLLKFEDCVQHYEVFAG